MSPRLLLFSLVALTLCPSAFAQPDPVTSEERRSVVERITSLLTDRYVFADKGVEAGTHLRAQLSEGAYDDLTTPSAFAEAVTADLQRVTADKHLRLRPAQPNAARNEPRDPIGEHIAWQERAREQNLGIRAVQVLDGNIGYLDLRSFPPEELVRDAYDAAMRLLANVDALIIDERQHGGGSPSGIRYLTSYFFDEPTHLNSLHWRQGDTEVVEEFWTLDEVSGPQRPDLPLFVLTSDYTFSGAEEFANNLKELGRATIVGETTGGGANPGGTMPAGKRFSVFIPEGRAVNPISGTNWEGVGVQPDVAVAAEDALDRALPLARSAASEYNAAREHRIGEAVEALRSSLAGASAAAASGRDVTADVQQPLHAALDAGIVDENIINQLGYEHLAAGPAALAVALFRFNVATYPESWNVYDSLAEALAAQGDREAAAIQYRRARSLAPSSQHDRIDEALRSL